MIEPDNLATIMYRVKYATLLRCRQTQTVRGVCDNASFVHIIILLILSKVLIINQLAGAVL
jgi:hypothetical protein